jgi:hypothetical protein
LGAIFNTNFDKTGAEMEKYILQQTELPGTVITIDEVGSGILVHTLYYNSEKELVSTDTIFLYGYSYQTYIDENKTYRLIVKSESLI